MPSSIVVLLSLAPDAAAATLTVGPSGTYATIRDGLLAAAPGDVVEVEPGTYQEQAVDLPIDVDIVGTGGAISTTWVGPPDADVLQILDGVTTTITGFTLQPTGDARAVDVFNANITLDDIVVTATDPSPRQGGAIRIRPGAEATLSNISLTDNAVDGDGGAIHVEGATLTLSDCDLSRNSANLGGGLFAVDTTLTMADCLFDANEAEGPGGGLWTSASLVTLADVDFIDGASGVGQWAEGGDGAGALFDDGSEVTWVGGVVQDNASVLTGGGVQVESGSSAVFEGVQFIGNRGTFGGGLYAATSGLVEVRLSTFERNEATDDHGGAIRWRAEVGGTLTVTGTAFTGNLAAADGGGIAMSSREMGPAGEAVLDANTFEGNNAERGGAILATGIDSLEATHLSLCVNEANTGGAVLLADLVETRWTNNVFVENLAAGAGGAAYIEAVGAIDLVNNTLLGNAAADGGGLKVVNSPTTFTNNVVAFSPGGDGIRGEGPIGSVQVTYSLFWDNVTDDLPAPLASGDGLVFADPMLVDFSADQDCTNDQPWPASGSPLVDAGDPAILDADGSASDIGAFGGPDADQGAFEDLDGDGWFGSVDCDDGDATINPDADEVCDGVDNDCDGDVDGDPTDGLTWFADGDGDGFGTEAQTEVACSQPEGHVSAAGDCDDSMATVNPDAPEVCDGIDNDCDGAVDDAVAWWPDADGDGFGDAGAAPDETCDGLDGQVDNDLDCDDSDAAINPDADDLPGDGIDANCDGTDGLGPDSDADEGLVVGSGCGCQAPSGAPLSPAIAAGWLALLVARRRR